MMAIAPWQKVLYPQVRPDRGQFAEKSNETNNWTGWKTLQALMKTFSDKNNDDIDGNVDDNADDNVDDNGDDGKACIPVQ